MDPATPEGRILSALKRELRRKGVHYIEIADRLRVSEATVKRYLGGKGVTLTVVRKLAEIAELDFVALAMLGEQQELSAKQISRTQQEALRESRFLSAIYFLLWQGWTVSKIGHEFNLGAELDHAVARLEALGLIKSLEHGLKIQVAPTFGLRGNSPLVDLLREHAALFLAELNLHDARAIWSCSSARLSVASAAKFRELVEKLVKDSAELMLHDAALPTEDTHWYRIFVAGQPITRQKFIQAGH